MPNSNTKKPVVDLMSVLLESLEAAKKTAAERMKARRPTTIYSGDFEDEWRVVGEVDHPQTSAPCWILEGVVNPITAFVYVSDVHLVERRTATHTEDIWHVRSDNVHRSGS